MTQGNKVVNFQEKPEGSSSINGGFFVLSPAVLDYIEGDSTVWEREPLECLASEGQLAAYDHRGFWHAMDTLRDKNQLEAFVEFRQRTMESVEMNPQFWRDRRVFLTGHTGFKGGWLALWLQSVGAKVAGYSLDPPSRPSLFALANVDDGMESVHGDILDLERLPRNG